MRLDASHHSSIKQVRLRENVSRLLEKTARTTIIILFAPKYNAIFKDTECYPIYHMYLAKARLQTDAT
jgi:hypothetical protein